MSNINMLKIKYLVVPIYIYIFIFISVLANIIKIVVSRYDICTHKNFLR